MTAAELIDMARVVEEPPTNLSVRLMLSLHPPVLLYNSMKNRYQRGDMFPLASNSFSLGPGGVTVMGVAGGMETEELSPTIIPDEVWVVPVSGDGGAPV